MSNVVLYSYYRSSLSHCVRIALNLKQIPYEYRAVHLLNNEQFSAEYETLNPGQSVPTLLIDGKVLIQSMAILDYLDHYKVSPRLFPVTPYERAVVIQAAELVNSGAQPLHNLRVLRELAKRFGADEDQRVSWAAHWVRISLKAIENYLKPHAGDFSIGNQPTAADCYIMSHLATADRYRVDLADFALLTKIRKTCSRLDAFRMSEPGVQPDTPK